MSSDCPAYSTGALSRDVGDHLRQRNTALYGIRERHGWVKVSAGNRPESADQRNQSRSGSNGIYQKSHRAVSAGESFAHDPRAHYCGHQEAGPDRLTYEPMLQIVPPSFH
jgi:hypothetical protein